MNVPLKFANVLQKIGKGVKMAPRIQKLVVTSAVARSSDPVKNDKSAVRPRPEAILVTYQILF